MVSDQPFDIDPRDLAKRAIMELDRNNICPALRDELTNGLEDEPPTLKDHEETVMSKQ